MMGSKLCEFCEATQPNNFSWIDEGRLAAMAWPQTPGNLQFLVDQGITHLVTLSPERIPPVDCVPELEWTSIPIQELGVPTLAQIQHFIEICQCNRSRNEAVGIHCRQGKGRTGTMAACYLVYFYGLQPRQAILSIRQQRPGSLETYEQEKVVDHYRDYLQQGMGPGVTV